MSLQERQVMKIIIFLLLEHIFRVHKHTAVSRAVACPQLSQVVEFHVGGRMLVPASLHAAEENAEGTAPHS